MEPYQETYNDKSNTARELVSVCMRAIYDAAESVQRATDSIEESEAFARKYRINPRAMKNETVAARVLYKFFFDNLLPLVEKIIPNICEQAQAGREAPRKLRRHDERLVLNEPTIPNGEHLAAQLESTRRALGQDW